MKKLIIVAIITLFTSTCFAEYRIDPYTGEMENHLTKKHHPQHKQQPVTPTPRYNPQQNTFQNTPQQSVLKTNPFSGKTEYSHPDGQLKYNPYSKKWEYED